MIDKKKTRKKKRDVRNDGAFGEKAIGKREEGGKRGRNWIDAKASKPKLKKEEAKGNRVNRCLIVICQSLNVVPLRRSDSIFDGPWR